MNTNAMSRNSNVDEEASLALARKLQAEYDMLAFSSHSHQGSASNDKSRFVDDFEANFGHQGSPLVASNLKQTMNDLEYARLLDKEINAITPPMSDEEFARLLQMQEDVNYTPYNSVHSSNHFAPPSPPTSAEKGKQPMIIPTTSQANKPLSPPITPGQRRISSSLQPPPPPYTEHNDNEEPQPPPLLRPPTPPEGWVEPMDTSEPEPNDPAIAETLRLAQQLSQNSREHSSTDDDEMLARLLQEEYGTEPSFWPEDEDFAKKLQAEFDNEPDYSIGQPATSSHNFSGFGSGIQPFLPPNSSFSRIKPVPQQPSFPPVEPSTSGGDLVHFPMIDPSSPKSLPPIPMVGTFSSTPVDPLPPAEAPTQPSTSTEISSALENIPQNPMTDEIFINWFRQWVTKSYSCESCDHGLVPLQLALQTQARTIHCDCPNCERSICLACMKRACNNACKSNPEKCTNVTHCALARPMLLFRILCSLDRFYITERNQQKYRDQQRPRQNKPQTSGIGFGSDFYHTPYHPNPYQPYVSHQVTSQQPQNQSKQRDNQLLSFFRGIAWILKGSSTEPGLLNLMRISLLGQAIEELLRNDSISDCSERAELYSTFLAALEAIASNPYLTEFYTSPRHEIESTDGLEKIISGQGKIIKRKKMPNSTHGSRSTDSEDMAPPLLELMENLGKQADTFYKTSGKVAMNAADTSVVNSINLCKSIIGIRQLLQMMAEQTGYRTAPSAPPKRDETEAYRLACADVAYDEFPPSVHIPFYYNQLAQSVRAAHPRRTITLAKELSTMATSLPAGIFVRNIPNRPDCIKALIAGPEGTPYYGGLFEFDIFATENYPAAPPQVRLVTTANGRVRFNPNLYQDGKVCLSLLGTWRGRPEEEWQPNKSTIMQILISIQGMLLCARPYYNEPGSGEARDTAVSLAYDREVRLQTVRVAICDWMTAAQSRGLWKDVIKMHFAHYATALRKHIAECARHDPRFKAYTISTMSSCGMGGIGGMLLPGTGPMMPPPLAIPGPPPMAMGPVAFGPMGPVNNFGENRGPENLMQRYEQGLETIKSW